MKTFVVGLFFPQKNQLAICFSCLKVCTLCNAFSSHPKRVFTFYTVYMRVLAISELSDERISFSLCLFSEQCDEDLTALLSMGISAALKCMMHDKTALFVGQWAAPFLLLGIYNKIVKTEGHD